MHLLDYTFIFFLALVLFGPKKLPEIGRQPGKLLAEFRRASNEFKFQIQEEMRNMEEEERRKKLAEQQAALAATPVAAEPASTASSEQTPAVSSVPTTPMILPPSTGTPVAAGRPYANPGEEPESAGPESGASESALPEAEHHPAVEHNAPAAEHNTAKEQSNGDASALPPGPLAYSAVPAVESVAMQPGPEAVTLAGAESGIEFGSTGVHHG